MTENPNPLNRKVSSTSLKIEADADVEAGRQAGDLVKSATSSIVKSSNFQAALTLFKSFIGTGILALPFAFKTFGVFLSIIGVTIIGILLTHCFLLLIRTADDRGDLKRASMQKLAKEIVGSKGKYFVQISLLLSQLGCCIGILIFTKDFLNHLLCSFDFGSLCDNVIFNLAFALTLTLPLSFINNMHYFYIPSMAANVFIIIGLFTQSYYNIQQMSDDSTVQHAIGERLTEFHFNNLYLFFGTALYSFEGVGNTLYIRDSMQNPGDLPKLLKRQMVILTAIYIIFATLSYLALGNDTPDIIFFSLPTNDPFYLLIQIFYAVSVLFSYPIQLFPAVRIVENSKLLRFKLFNETGHSKNKPLRYVVRIFVIAFVFAVAYSVKSFHIFLNIMGSCVFVLLAFSIPIVLYMVNFKDRMSKKQKIINSCIFIFTVALGIYGFVMSIVNQSSTN